MVLEEPLFRPAIQGKRKSSLPWSDRQLLRGMNQFGPDTDGFVVFVTDEAQATLRQKTQQRAPSEAFGLLMGRVFEDSQGCYVVVTGAVYATQLQSSASHVQLTAREMDELRSEARRLEPAGDFIGWTHSHSVPSPYSRTDESEQKTWVEPYNIGILTFMEGEPWASVYRGPQSRRLSLNEEVQPFFKSLTQKPQMSLPPFQRSNEEMVPVSGTSMERFIRRSLVYVFALVVISFLISTMGVIAVLIHLNGSITALQAEMKHPAPSNIIWNCDQQQGKVPLTVHCNGPVGPGITGWDWDFGDGTVMHADTVTHTYTVKGKYIITLKVITASGNIAVGTLQVQAVGPHSPA